MEESKEETKEAPKGYYLAEVPSQYTKIVALDGKQVDADELLIKMANALRDAGIMKE